MCVRVCVCVCVCVCACVYVCVLCVCVCMCENLSITKFIKSVSRRSLVLMNSLTN